MSHRCGTCKHFHPGDGNVIDDRRCRKANRPLSIAHRDVDVPGWCPGWEAFWRVTKDLIHEPAHYPDRKKPCSQCEEWLDCYANADRPCQEGLSDGHLYTELDRVLALARAHAAQGKGKERHALPGQPFEEQVIVADSLALGSNHGNLLQIIKKAKESARLHKDAAIAELLGVINNAAAAVLVLERLNAHEERNGSWHEEALQMSSPLAARLQKMEDQS